MRVSDSQNMASSTSFGKIDIIEDSKGQLHRKRFFLCCAQGMLLGRALKRRAFPCYLEEGGSSYQENSV